jgi:hypothetical protein
MCTREDLAVRKQQVRETLSCPYCEEKLAKWRVPESPFNEWPSEFQYICFNDRCDYFVKGWFTMAAQGSFGSYRFMYDPSTNGCHPLPVLSREARRESIVVRED